MLLRLCHASASPLKSVSFVSYPDLQLRKNRALLSCNFESARRHRHLSPRHYRALSVLTHSPGFALAAHPIAFPACLCLAHRLLLVPAGSVSASERFRCAHCAVLEAGVARGLGHPCPTIILLGHDISWLTTTLWPPFVCLSPASETSLRTLMYRLRWRKDYAPQLPSPRPTSGPSSRQAFADYVPTSSLLADCLSSPALLLEHFEVVLAHSRVVHSASGRRP